MDWSFGIILEHSRVMAKWRAWICNNYAKTAMVGNPVTCKRNNGNSYFTSTQCCHWWNANQGRMCRLDDSESRRPIWCLHWQLRQNRMTSWWKNCTPYWDRLRVLVGGINRAWQWILWHEWCCSWHQWRSVVHSINLQLQYITSVRWSAASTTTWLHLPLLEFSHWIRMYGKPLSLNNNRSSVIAQQMANSFVVAKFIHSLAYLFVVQVG